MSSGIRGRSVTMVDYGGSNLRSVQKAFEAVGARVAMTSDPEQIRRAELLVLPGVGAFGTGMAAIRERGLDEAIVAAAGRDAPLLGICLGMQFLFDESEEMGNHRGLGLIHGRVRQFESRRSTEAETALKVPHMGWNRINFTEEHPLLAGVAPGSHAYFVHSYYCAPIDSADILASSDYGISFAAIAGRGRIYGIQFHPEKSQQIGLKILENYSRLEVG